MPSQEAAPQPVITASTEHRAVLGPDAARRGELVFAVLLAAAFALVTGFATAHHELWRDEAHAWLLVRDSASPMALLHAARYGGHPYLWYVLLWPLVRITHDPSAMQALSVTIVTAAAFIVARYAPSPRWVRALAVLGYFPVYEYGTIARNYGLGLLALVAFCALFPRRRERPLLVAATLFVLANTSLPALLLALAAAGGLAIEVLWLAPEARSRATWGGLAIVALGVLLAVAQMVPPSDSGFAVAWKTDLDPSYGAYVLSDVTSAFLPLPMPGRWFWQTEVLLAFSAYREYAWILAVLIVIAVAVALLRRPVALVYYLSATLALLSFFYAKYNGYLRHHGFLFLAFGSALWLAAYSTEAPLSRSIARVVVAAERSVRVVAAIVFALHVVAGAIAVWGEYRFAFSGAKQTAALMRERRIGGLPMVAAQDDAASAVLAYLDKEGAYYPAGGRNGSFVLYDEARTRPFDLWREVDGFASRTGGPVAAVLTVPVLQGTPAPPELLRRTRAEGCGVSDVVPDESFCVFTVWPRP